MSPIELLSYYFLFHHKKNRTNSPTQNQNVKAMNLYLVFVNKTSATELKINMSTMESFKSEPQFSPFSPRKPSLFLFFARSCSITLYRTQPIKIELLSYYLTIMVRYRNLVRQIGPSESTGNVTAVFQINLFQGSIFYSFKNNLVADFG